MAIYQSKYPKINTIFKRGEKGKLLYGQYSRTEFEYLKDNIWVFTEKIDGTNIRIIWIPKEEIPYYFGAEIPEIDIFDIKGKSDNAQIPPFLLEKLKEIFTANKFRQLYPKTPMILYGEGYGNRIQKAGSGYIKDDVDFILFDVLVDNMWWLKREDVVDIATQLGVLAVPVIGKGTIKDAVILLTSGNGLLSDFGNFQAEGLVLRPEVELFSRNGKRIITKMKHKDF